MDIVLFGIQGSGKGTLGKAVSQKYGFNYFETGGELRKLAQDSSELGQKVKSVIESGKLVSNEIVLEIVQNFIEQNDKKTPIIFDGFPREMGQAGLFDELMDKEKREFMCILVDIPEEEAMKRLTTRRICSKCKTVYPAAYSGSKCEKCGGDLITRSDDTPDSIKTRIEAFQKETTPVISKYQTEGKMVTMDGTPPIAEAAEIMFGIIDSLKIY